MKATFQQPHGFLMGEKTSVPDGTIVHWWKLCQLSSIFPVNERGVEHTGLTLTPGVFGLVWDMYRLSASIPYLQSNDTNTPQ